MPATITTYTYTATDLPQPISDNLPAAVSSIVIPNNFLIYDLDVRVNIAHTYDRDLRITLTGPSGSCVLADRVGDRGHNFSGTIFDAEATTPITESAPPFTGRFRPQNVGDFIKFYGKNAAGLWQLRVEDLAAIDTGSLTEFTLFASASNVLSVTVLSSTGVLRKGEQARIFFLLSAPVTNFSPAAVAASGGTLSGLTGSGTYYTAIFTPTVNASGEAEIIIPANTLTTVDGEQNLQSTSPRINFDTRSAASQPKTPAAPPPKNAQKPVAPVPLIDPKNLKIPILTGDCGRCGEWRVDDNGDPFCKEPVTCGPAGPNQPKPPPVPPTNPCPAGTTWSKRGECVPVPVPGPTSCPPGTVWSKSGSCVPVPPNPTACPAGTVWSKSGKCVPISKGPTSCPTGTTWSKGGDCVPVAPVPPTNPCPSGTYRSKGGDCVPNTPAGPAPCPSGTYRSKGGDCVPVAPVPPIKPSKK